MDRTLHWGIIFSSILIGVAFSKLKTNYLIAGVLIFVIIAHIDIKNYISERYAGNEDWKSASTYINDDTNILFPLKPFIHEEPL